MLSTQKNNTQEETQDNKDDFCSPPPLKKRRVMGALRFRASKRDIKSAVMYSSSPFQDRSPNSIKKIENALQSGAAQVALNRPIKKVVASSANGTPRQVITPGETRLFLKKDYGVMRIFTEESYLPFSPARPLMTQVGIEKKEQIEQSIAYQQIKNNLNNVKMQELWITTEQIEKAKKEIEENHGKRICSQNKVMVKEGLGENKGSANHYGNEFILAKQKKLYEWLHMVAHKLKANESQNENNLVCGMSPANTDMMFVEFQHPILSQYYPQGYKLEVVAHVVQGLTGSQFSTTIDYIIETNDFRLPFKFNGQSDVKPNLFNLDYVEALVLASIPHMKLHTKGHDKNFHVFFSRQSSKRKLDYSSIDKTDCDAQSTLKNDSI